MPMCCNTPFVWMIEMNNMYTVCYYYYYYYYYYSQHLPCCESRAGHLSQQCCIISREYRSHAQRHQLVTHQAEPSRTRIFAAVFSGSLAAASAVYVHAVVREKRGNLHVTILVPRWAAEEIRGHAESQPDGMLAIPSRRLFLAAFGLYLVVVAVLRDSVGTSYKVAVLHDRLLWGWAFRLNYMKRGCYVMLWSTIWRRAASIWRNLRH